MNERSIFAEAIEREDPKEQAAYLDEACGGDAVLRTRVRKLLRAYGQAQSFLETPPAALIATIVGGEFEASDQITLDFLEPSEKPGCLGTLGQYEVVEAVGRGGMGIVLRAYDTKLNRVVAIKVIAPEMAANATAVKRFLREAQAAAAVSHDHVVTIHAIHDESRLPYLVMECIEGPSLQERIARTGGFELNEILRIGMQAAAGLAAAHQQGLVHRDIKPANLLLENGVERVKITDFGLARAVDDVSMTQPGLISGTPQYMSPEQAQGSVVDHRSDLFSLGSVLYTMCAGHPPFQADTSIAMLRAVLEDAPRPIGELNPKIPAWLEAIIARLLAKNPEHRFQSALALSELLGKWLSHVQNPQAHEPPVSAWFGEDSPNTFRRAVASFWKRVPLKLLLTLHLLCIAGFVMVIAIEVEAVILAGPVCSLLGLGVAFVGWSRSRSVLSVGLGLSTVCLALLVTASIVFFRVGPPQAQAPVGWLVLVYELLAIPAGLAVLLTADRERAKGGWPRPLRFNLRTLLSLTAVAGISFAAVRFAVSLSFVRQSDSPIAAAIGVFVATVMVLAWTMLRATRGDAIADLERLRDDPPFNPTRIFKWIAGLSLAAAAGFVGFSCLLLWEFERTNIGYVVFDSPVSDLMIERLDDGRVERVYDTLQGGGTRWQVPVGRWQFRIQGDRPDYRLSQTDVSIDRGVAITIDIAPTEAMPATAAASVWDELISAAEQEFADAQSRYKGGTISVGDLSKAEAGLIEAKIQRERSRNNQQEVVSLLKQLIQSRQKELESSQALYRGNKISQSDLQSTIKSLAEAQAALQEASAGE